MPLDYLAHCFQFSELHLGRKHILTVAVVINTKSDFVKIRKRIEEIKSDLSKVGLRANIEVKFVFYNIRNMDLELSDDKLEEGGSL